MKWIFLFLIGLSFSAQALESLILAPGEKTAIPVPPDQTLRLGNKKLIQLEQQGSQLLIFARSKGETLLVAGGKRYRLLVLEPELKKQAQGLSQILQSMRGLKWVFLPESQSFEIRGELFRFSDWLELAKYSKKTHLKYEFRASLDEELKKISLYYFQQLLPLPLKIFWQELPLVRLPQSAPILGYQNRLEPFGLIPKEQDNWFFKAPFIQIEWALVESLSSSSGNIGGILDKNWADLPAFLNFLRSSGWGKSLHHSFVLVQSGKSIKLESGGQIPFNQYNFKTEQSSLAWKSYGWNLELSPTLDIKHQIQLKVQASFSEPLSFPSDSPPPLKNQNIETELVLSPLKIVKLFEWKKQSKGRQYSGQINFLPQSPKSLLGRSNRYNTVQSIFLRIKILDNNSESSDKNSEPLKKSPEFNPEF